MFLLSGSHNVMVILDYVEYDLDISLSILGCVFHVLDTHVVCHVYLLLCAYKDFEYIRICKI